MIFIKLRINLGHYRKNSSSANKISFQIYLYSSSFFSIFLLAAIYFFNFHVATPFSTKVFVESLLLIFIILIKTRTMKKSFFFSMIMVGGLFLSLTNAAVTINEVQNVDDPICPYFSDEVVADLPSSSSGNIEYIAASSFYDNTNDLYTEIMVREGNQSNPFRFLFFDDKSISHEIACEGTTGFQFVRLINNFLFLKQTDPEEKYHVCRFNPAIALNSVDGFSTKIITLPGGVSSPMTKFIPYSVRQSTANTEWTINILFNDGSVAKAAQYAWTTIDTSATDLTATITETFTQMDGVEDVIYNNQDGFAILTGTTYAADAEVLPEPAQGSIVSFYRTLTRTSLIGVSPTATTASFYLVRYTTQLDVTEFDEISGSSTDPFLDFFDESANIMIISTTQVAWINVATDDTMLKVIATTTEIPTQNLQSVAFLEKTAVFTYTNKLVQYQMTGNDSLSKRFSHTTQSSIPGESDQRIIAMSCFCKVMKRLSCYSSTLKCLLLRKGTETCTDPASLTGTGIVVE